MLRPEEQNPEEQLRAMHNAVGKSLDIIGRTGEDPMQVFPGPQKGEDRRKDVEWDIVLAPEQEEAFRDLTAEFGIGREENLTPADLGVQHGYVAIAEGGLVGKMMAQLSALELGEEGKPQPSMIVLTADPKRVLKGEEPEDVKNKLGLKEGEEVPKNEYELALAVMAQQPGFKPIADASLEVYTDNDEYYMAFAGEFNGAPVHIMGVKRRPNPENPEKPLRFSNKEKIVTVASNSDAEGKQIVFVTGANSQPNNQIQAIRAQQETGSDIKVASYGAVELAKAKGLKSPERPTIDYVAREWYKVSKEILAKA